MAKLTNITNFARQARNTAGAGAVALGLAFAPAMSHAEDITPISTSVTRDNADIVISYGSAINIDMDDVIEALAYRDVNAIAVQDFDVPNCAALILDGVEVYRYSEESIDNDRLTATASRLVKGKKLGRSAASDCDTPYQVASLERTNDL